MARRTLMALAGLAVASLPAAALAQSDPAARALIMQLSPRTSATDTRGIRPAAGGSAAVTSLPAAPRPAPASLPVPEVRAPAVAAPQAAAATSLPRPPAASAPARTTTAPADIPAASITVTFASGSAELTPAAEAALAPLGRALSSAELSGYRFRIEGHTDTVGSREMNLSLSERRAATVRDYLVQRFGVDPARLEAVGRGEDDLLVRTADEVPERRNRRVQVLNLGS